MPLFERSQNLFQRNILCLEEYKVMKKQISRLIDKRFIIPVFSFNDQLNCLLPYFLGNFVNSLFK
jgi:hypothetical protein